MSKKLNCTKILIKQLRLTKQIVNFEKINIKYKIIKNKLIESAKNSVSKFATKKEQFCKSKLKITLRKDSTNYN